MKYLKVSNIKIDIEQNIENAFNLAIKTAGVSKQDIIAWKPLKYSIDARDKSSLKKIYTIQLQVADYNKKRKIELEKLPK